MVAGDADAAWETYKRSRKAGREPDEVSLNVVVGVTLMKIRELTDPECTKNAKKQRRADQEKEAQHVEEEDHSPEWKEWADRAIATYHEATVAGVRPRVATFSAVLACLRPPTLPALRAFDRDAGPSGSSRRSRSSASAARTLMRDVSHEDDAQVHITNCCANSDDGDAFAGEIEVDLAAEWPREWAAMRRCVESLASAAAPYLADAPDGRAECPITAVLSGQESPAFLSHFVGWTGPQADPFEAKLNELGVEPPVSAATVDRLGCDRCHDSEGQALLRNRRLRAALRRAARAPQQHRQAARPRPRQRQQGAADGRCSWWDGCIPARRPHPRADPRRQPRAQALRRAAGGRATSEALDGKKGI